MSRLVLYMSMSLDGFIAGPGDDKDNPFGTKGHRLHEWLGDGGEDVSGFRPSDEPSRTVFDELMSTGAVITGRRTGDFVDYWGGDHHDGVPIFVPTHQAPTGKPLGDVRFVTDDIESCVEQAKAAAGDRDVMLHGGSRIAYVGLPAEREARPAPVIFLHGGPGVPDMKGDARYFGGLARDGFDVYVYDEVGSGRSTRLADPRGYTLERDVADLEAIRQEIGAEKVVLIGHSYGGVIAAAYAASHPERVEKMVLSSPGDPGPSAGGASMLFRLTAKEKLGVYRLLLPPRPMLAYALLQVNPEAAHAFAGDVEMDARFDRVYNATHPALRCRGEPAGPKLHGLGFYANQYPQSAASEPRPDFLPDLAGRNIPTLLVKGRCDYLSWSSATKYLQTLPDARLAYLRGAGHNAYRDEPGRYVAIVRAFLRGQHPSQQTYTGERMPEGYEGPR